MYVNLERKLYDQRGIAYATVKESYGDFIVEGSAVAWASYKGVRNYSISKEPLHKKVIGIRDLSEYEVEVA